MRFYFWTPRLVAAVAVTGLLSGLAVAASAASEDPDTLVRTNDPERYQISVSATKLARRTEDVANGMTVVSGDELRRRGTRTVAEALQDVVGFDTGEGSDNGTTVPNLGMWGLKEFDALLVTVNGMPVGGPFNPSLTQIPVEDIDRIEVVKGPQGTLYGISAFAGMVQVFTRAAGAGRVHATIGGGSFSGMRGNASLSQTLSDGTQLSVSGGASKSDNWQDRTPSERQNGRVSLERAFGKVSASLDGGAYYDSQKWGTPLPVDAGKAIPGFVVDRNYAVGGARMDHHVISGNLHLAAPVNEHVRVENTLGAYQDRGINVRSWVDAGAAAGLGSTVPAEVVYVRPIEKAVFDELRFTGNFEAGGRHDLVAGGAVTYGKLDLAGEGADFDQTLGDFSSASIPDVGSIAAGDLRSGRDRRTFLGVYARDEWTPVSQFTLGGGGRYDNASETLHAQAQEQGPPLGTLESIDDKRTDKAWSGDVSALVRLLPHPTAMFDAVNVYGNWKSSFKPAAPNLSEGEGAKILDPEHTHSIEGGVKIRGFDEQLSLDVSAFDMTFTNMVVGTLNGLVNAGGERFKGYEAQLTVQPKVVPGTTISIGYANHDARFVHFSFLADPTTLRVVDGKRIELVPQDLFNARLDYRARCGASVFGALRTQGGRPLTRRNTFWAEGFSEYDAGGAYTYQQYTVSVTGRNLGDDRHYTTESEIGDSEFYVSPPRRVSAELSVSF